MARNAFPVTATDDPQPGDPKLEPTREQVNRNPEGLPQFIERTRRYFRLTNRPRKLHYARGLDSKPDDFA